MGNLVLEDRYESLCRGSSDIYQHLPTFVQAVYDLNATKVIELGVRSGISTIAWLYALEGQGCLWSVDVSFPVPEEGVALLDPQGPLGCVPHWLFLLGYDDSPQVLDALPDQVDIVFVDTQHTFEITTRELELYVPRVRSGGRLFFHDSAIEVTGNATTPQPLFPVKTAVSEFCAAHNLEWTNTDECSGLATVHIP